MGIVVCLSMLIGIIVLQPTPWDRASRIAYNPKFMTFSALILAVFGSWNSIYGFFYIGGFWRWASVLSGGVMLMSSIYILVERKIDASSCYVRQIVVVLLAVSFLLYAVTIVQLNLGYPILR